MLSKPSGMSGELAIRGIYLSIILVRQFIRFENKWVPLCRLGRNDGSCSKRTTQHARNDQVEVARYFLIAWMKRIFLRTRVGSLVAISSKRVIRV